MDSNQRITPPPHTTHSRDSYTTWNNNSDDCPSQGLSQWINRVKTTIYKKSPKFVQSFSRNLKRRKNLGKVKKIFSINGGEFNKKDYSLFSAKYITIGKNVEIYEGFNIQTLDSYGGVKLKPHLILEDEVSIKPNFTALVEDTLWIKKRTRIAGNCTILTNNHGTDAESEVLYGFQPLTTAPVIIGEECWIGINVTILPGVEIGKRCIIAAGAIVTKSIPAYSIAAGIPAKVVKKWDFENHKWVHV